MLILLLLAGCTGSPATPPATQSPAEQEGPASGKLVYLAGKAREVQAGLPLPQPATVRLEGRGPDWVLSDGDNNAQLYLTWFPGAREALVIRALGQGDQDLYFLDLGSGSLTPLARAFRIMVRALSPGGRYAPVYVLAASGKNVSLYVFDRKTRELALVAAGGLEVGLKWLGPEEAVIAGQVQLNLDTWTSQELALKGAFQGMLKGGQAVSLEMPDGPVYVEGPATGRAAVTPPGAHGGPASVAPGGRWLAALYQTGSGVLTGDLRQAVNTLLLYDASTGESWSTPLGFRQEFFAHELYWSDDGRYLVFTESNRNVHLVTPEKKSHTVVYRSPVPLSVEGWRDGGIVLNESGSRLLLTLDRRGRASTLVLLPDPPPESYEIRPRVYPLVTDDLLVVADAGKMKLYTRERAGWPAGSFFVNLTEKGEYLTVGFGAGAGSSQVFILRPRRQEAYPFYDNGTLRVESREGLQRRYARAADRRWKLPPGWEQQVLYSARFYTMNLAGVRDALPEAWEQSVSGQGLVVRRGEGAVSEEAVYAAQSTTGATEARVALRSGGARYTIYLYRPWSGGPWLVRRVERAVDTQNQR